MKPCQECQRRQREDRQELRDMLKLLDRVKIIPAGLQRPTSVEVKITTNRKDKP